jgi:DNA-binding NtrC family response regulator
MFPNNLTYPEAVLVVDDDPFLLQCACATLRRAGFYVFSASCPGDAFDIESVYPGEIRLLLSDVMMPDMTGPELAAELTARRREMRVLLMSACDARNRPRLEPGWRFLPKPFAPEVLVDAVSDALAAEGRDAPASLEFATLRHSGNLARTEPSGGLHV